MWTPADCRAGAIARAAGTLAALGLSVPAYAQSASPRHIEIITASDGQAGDGFGVAIDCEAGVLVIGADRDDDGCPGQLSTCNSGAAYVYERIGDRWVEVAKLRLTPGAVGDRFGASVAVSNGVIVVAAVGDDEISNNSGAAYVFERIDGVWTRTAKLKAQDAWPSDNFGESVAIDGDVIAVGAVLDDDGADNSGSVYVFERTLSGGWAQAARLRAPDPGRLDNLGASVAVRGGVVVAGAPNDEPAGAAESVNKGSVCVWERTESGWGPGVKLVAPDAGDNDRLGRVVAIGDGVLIASASGGEANSAGAAQDTGSVHVWRRVKGAWTHDVELAPPDGARDDGFGLALRLVNDELLVGAPNHDFGASGAGAAYLYRRAAGAWGTPVKLVRPTPRASDLFGGAAGMVGSEMLVGATGDDLRGASAGAVDVMTTGTCRLDLSGDGAVSSVDVQLVIARWGQKGPSVADLNGDGVVNSADLALLLGSFGPCP